MDIIELPCAKKSKNPSKNNYLYSKTRPNPVQGSYMLTKKTKCDTMQTIKAKRLNMTSLPFAFCRAKIWHISVRMEGKS